MKNISPLLIIIIITSVSFAGRSPSPKPGKYRSPASAARQANKRRKEQRIENARDRKNQVKIAKIWTNNDDNISDNSRDIAALKSELKGIQRQLNELLKQNKKLSKQIAYLKKIIKDAGVGDNNESGSPDDPNSPAIKKRVPDKPILTDFNFKIHEKQDDEWCFMWTAWVNNSTSTWKNGYYLIELRTENNNLLKSEKFKASFPPTEKPREANNLLCVPANLAKQINLEKSRIRIQLKK